jgi:RNA polymerase sigma factor (sigma-70 family)
MTDLELLREYASRGSEDAFATLVKRYGGLVYSAAFRQSGHVQDAEEITQAVFVILARKAAGLRQDTVLPGWLLGTTRFVAMNARRRQLHRLPLDHNELNENRAEATAGWEQLASVLDEALGRLSVKDRDAVVLRYFEEQSFKDIARLTAATEDGAQKRVTRAVEKLRIHFQRRGLLLPSVSILTAITANAVQAAPAQMTATVVATIKSGTALTGSVGILVKVGLGAFKAARLKAIGLGSGAVAFLLPVLWFTAAKLLSEDPLADLSVRSIVTSADGTKLVATGSGVGLVYASVNSGADWHATSAPRGLWQALASSADGT